MAEFQPISDQEKAEKDKYFNIGEKAGLMFGVNELARGLTDAEYRATHDDLTGLYNKGALRKKAEAALRGGGDYGMIFIDLTNFKAINDKSPGKHATGDGVLKSVAAVIEHSVRTGKEDAAAHERRYEPADGEAGRVGGDEFAIFLDLNPRTDEGSKWTPAERLSIVKDRLKKTLNLCKTRYQNFRAMVLTLPLVVRFGSRAWTFLLYLKLPTKTWPVTNKNNILRAALTAKIFRVF